MNRKQDNNAIVKIAMDEIMLHDNNKISDVWESPEKIEHNLMRTNFIIFTIRVLKTLKKNFNDVVVRLNKNLKVYMGLIINMI